MGPRTGLDVVAKRKILSLWRESNHNRQWTFVTSVLGLRDP